MAMVGGAPAAGSAGSGRAARILVGLGTDDLEQRLLPGLTDAGYIIADRCLSADQLLAALSPESADAVLLAADLHRLTRAALDDVLARRIPAVVLWNGQLDARGGRTVCLPLDATAADLQAALDELLGGHAPAVVAPSVTPEPPPTVEPQPDEPEVEHAVVAVTSGYGSPGRTTLAINLAAALGAVAPTALVDADLVGPSVAAYLDLDPTRNLYMLAHAGPETVRDWDRALDQELQSLDPRSRQAVALCGVPKPEMRSGISTRFMERLLAELRQRYRYVVVDTGPVLAGTDRGLHRQTLVSAGRVLLLATSDLVGLWHARRALNACRPEELAAGERLALVINRYDRRRHHGRAEIEWGLDAPLAGVVPYDHLHAERAIAAQRPMVVLPKGPAAKALLELADRLHGGGLALPPDPLKRPPRWRTLRVGSLVRRPQLPWPRRNGHLKPAREESHGGAGH